ncbi:MAG TPA: hypothetical protein VFJ16_22385 [Longimicrobium sp.]|nr:hypothetical protein [Longimicrobium sp.]
MADTLAFHAAAPGGGEGYVLLLQRPDADGQVAWRQWSSDDYMAPAREGTSPAEELASRVEGWARAGWALSESPHRITGWLRAR